MWVPVLPMTCPPGKSLLGKPCTSFQRRISAPFIGLRRGDVLARVGADVDAVGDLVVRAWLPAAVAAGTGALTALAAGLIHPPAGLVLGACLLLAGIAGPLVTMRSCISRQLSNYK